MPSFSEQMLLLPSALLAMSLPFSFGENLEPRATTVPAPISFAPDENWDGIDGQWSTFTLRIGTPEQIVRTLISFQSYQTWAVGPQGCQSAPEKGACSQQRGGSYNNDSSSTADYIGIYELWVDRDLGMDSNAIFVYDTLALGLEGENGPTLKNTTVGQMAADTFYLGMFGLDPKPTNFTNFSDGSPSSMTLLKQQGSIPSLSAGYTAGAQYRSTGKPASLILGGYDSSKFMPNNISFSFAADNEKFLMIGVQSITTPSSAASSPVRTELLPDAIYALLDTSVAEIWLPLEACRAFEEVFGIEYDNATELYLVNQTLHDKLKASNPTINFTLAQDLTTGPTVQIELPYGAFDLTAQPPYQGLQNESFYFPLRRAANDSQYTLGRTLFQEAYLAVDWEAQRFNVSQCIWTHASSENIVAIPPLHGTSASLVDPGALITGDNQGVSQGAIAGIAVGGFASIVLFAMLLLWIWQHRKKVVPTRAENEKLGQLDHDSASARSTKATVVRKAELDGSTPTPAEGPRQLRLSDQRSTVSSRSPTGLGAAGTSNPASSAGWHGSGRSSPRMLFKGEGTHSSAESSSQIGTSVLDSGSVGDPSDADSRERHVFEMAGDLPTIKEKDGRALSEKEAMIRREEVYNGMERRALARHTAARGPRRDALGRSSPEAVMSARGPRRSSVNGSSLASGGRPASRVSSDGDRRRISGTELTSAMSSEAKKRGINTAASGQISTNLDQSAVTGTGVKSPVSPVGVASPDWKVRGSVDGGMLESPVSPVSKRGTFFRLHRAFSFERQY